MAASPMPSEVPAPTATLDFSGAQATLTIVRTFDAALGHITITAAIPLLFGVDEEDPEQPMIVWGAGTGTATLNGAASGTGGSYTMSGEWPVEYEVRGSLTPARDECRMSLDVEEALLLSREIIAHVEPLGDIPITAGEDEFTAFSQLNFRETDPRVTLPGTAESVFTVDDWCLPKATYCTLGCPP